jgi:SAM-dependent methyltransferase
MERAPVLAAFQSPEKLKKHICANGCYSREENERIFDKWFSKAPRYLFRAVNRKYQLTDRTLCDVGCGYGANLLFCHLGSYGIELEEYAVKFARSIGCQVYERDVITDDLADLPQVEVVWNSAVLEHVESPHIFLRKLHMLLRPNGLLALYAPTIPPLPVLRHLPRLGQYFTGHLHGDHINAFTPGTLKFFCERAGFTTIEISAFYPPPLSIMSRKLFWVDGCVYIGRKADDWEYPPNATRRKAINAKGFRIVS